MLKCLELVLKPYPPVFNLENCINILVSFLGPTPCLPLWEACNFGSVKLLDMIWASSCVSASTRPSPWSLHNFLRSDTHYNQWQFAKSLEVAAGRGDLAVAKWLFEHFVGCEAPSDVVNVAAENGHLEMLRFLFLFKAEEVKIFDEEEVRAICQLDSSGRKNVVHWGNSVMLKAAENGQMQTLRWLYENEVHDVDDPQRVRIIEFALSAGDFDLVDCFLPTEGTTCELDYDRLSPSLELIEWMLDMGYLQKDEDVAASAFQDLAGFGDMELMKRILKLYPNFEDDDTIWLPYWGEAQRKACVSGDLELVKWLVEHPIGRKQCEQLKETRHIDHLLQVAAAGGHIKVVEYLVDQGAVDISGNAMLSAVRKGHTKVVEVLLDPNWYAEKGDAGRLTHEAVLNGRVDILSLFQKINSPAFVKSTQKCKRKTTTPEGKWWTDLGDLVSLAAANSQLDALEWLQANRKPKPSPCAIQEAAAAGHLGVVKWLHSVRADKCSDQAMDRAASAGHLDVVKWLHFNRQEGCTSDAINLAAAEAGTTRYRKRLSVPRHIRGWHQGNAYAASRLHSSAR